MFGILIACWIGNALNDGIYDRYLFLKDYPFLHEEPADHMDDILADHVMEDHLVVLEKKGYSGCNEGLHVKLINFET